MSDALPTFGPVAVMRDQLGYWDHPDVPWSRVPDEYDATPYFDEWGFELTYIEMDGDAPDEVTDAYFERGSADITAWTPSKPVGDGWFLVAIYDTDDGPCAAWARPTQAGEKGAL